MTILRLYLSIPAGHGVGKSQVYNWAEVLRKQGNIESKIIVNDTNEEPEEIKQMLEFDPVNTIVYKRKRIFIISPILFILFLARIIFRYARQYDKIIVQTRYIVLYFNTLKWLPKVKTVYEIRGAAEPIRYKSKLSRKYLKKHYLDLVYRNMLKANRVICVSNYMKNYFSKKYHVNKDKIFVVYGAADDKDFFFDPQLRESSRKAHGLEDKTIYIYSGKIDKHYTVPDRIFELFSIIKDIDPTAYFIVLTPNIDIAEQYREQFGISKKDVLIKESGYKELNTYYNLSDFGLLLRPESLVNKVASPTKFSEYMLCGLPCLISANVGDFSQYVADHQCGMVLPDVERLNGIKSLPNPANVKKRKEISERAARVFSKQSYIDDYVQMYKNV
jgi:glycosyltransferase involved in cell wall biosynthesis